MITRYIFKNIPNWLEKINRSSAKIIPVSRPKIRTEHNSLPITHHLHSFNITAITLPPT